MFSIALHGLCKNQSLGRINIIKVCWFFKKYTIYFLYYTLEKCANSMNVYVLFFFFKKYSSTIIKLFSIKRIPSRHVNFTVRFNFPQLDQSLIPSFVIFLHSVPWSSTFLLFTIRLYSLISSISQRHTSNDFPKIGPRTNALILHSLRSLRYPIWQKLKHRV